MFKVLIAQHIHPAGRELLAARDDIELIETEDISVENVSALAGEHQVDAISVRNGLVPESLIAASPKLKILSRHGVGVDAIDLDAASKRGVVVATTVTANARSVAEQTMAFILGLAKMTKRYDQQMAVGNFAVRYNVETIDLAGRTLLILGVGRIGRRVARLAKAFEMRVLGFDPGLSRSEIAARDCEPVENWHALLGKVDFLTLHCPKTPETLNLIAVDELEALGGQGCVINCARGGLVDEQALALALKSGTIRGAACDVFEVEPTPADHPLFESDRFIGSPHSAATSAEGIERMGREVAENILNFIDGTLEDERIYNLEALNRG